MKSEPALILRPDSEAQVTALAEKLLQRAGVLDVFPTPLELLFKIAKIEYSAEADAVKESFLKRLAQKGQEEFESLWQKLRGVADLRERVVYIPRNTGNPRSRFAGGHELGHQVIPWHNVDPTYLDDNKTLSLDVQQVFEQEANFFSAEVIFQGRRFTKRARDFTPTLEAIFFLADDYGASRHCTSHRFVEESDESLVLIPYWPSAYTVDESGLPVLRKGRAIASPAFSKQFSFLQLPDTIRTGHDWASARELAEVATGNSSLAVGTEGVEFTWQAWWNNYCLLVLLRRKPRLHLVRQLISRART